MAAGFPRGPTPDFAQDYAAAWAVHHGRPAASSTQEILALAWNAESAEPYRGTHQPHPPLATLLALPFAYLPFEVARVLWSLLGVCAVAGAWRIAAVPARSILATLPLWCLALVLGTHEPLLFALLAGALCLEARAPGRAGLLLGASIALKIYPVLLLPWLLARRRLRTLLFAGVGASLPFALGEVLLGPGSTADWISYTGVNASRYADVEHNLSLVRGMRELLPGLPPIVLGLALAAALSVLSLRRGARGSDAAVAVMLLASPLTWRHYLGLLGLARPAAFEDGLLAFGGMVALAFGLGWLDTAPRALAELPLFLALMSCWVRPVLGRGVAGAAR